MSAYPMMQGSPGLMEMVVSRNFSSVTTLTRYVRSSWTGMELQCMMAPTSQPVMALKGETEPMLPIMPLKVRTSLRSSGTLMRLMMMAVL